MAKERDRIHQDLDALEVADGNKPLDRDEGLARAAQQAADEVCQGARKLNDGSGIWNRAQAATQGYAKRGGLSWVGYRFNKAEIARVREGAKGKGYTRVGIGLCQGDLPERPRGTFVLLMEMGP